MKKDNSVPKTYIRDGRAPLPLRESTSRVMSANKGKNTKPEIIFRKYLWKLGLRGYRIHPKNILGKPDIVFPKYKLVIFINGCFWHRCPICNLPLPKTNTDFWAEKFQKNRERDNKINLELAQMGWKVIVIWECEIKRSINDCYLKVIGLF